MTTTCSIDFDNIPGKLVYSGQLLRSTIKLSLTDEERVHGIYYRIYGEAYCHWTKGINKARRSYTGREEYLDEKKYFIGSPSLVDEIPIAPGEHVYNIQIFLPQSLPSSVESGIGYIRYTANVIFNTPMGAHDKEFKQRFCVLRPLYLNFMLRTPICAEDTSALYFGGIFTCLKSSPIEVRVNIPVGGYAPGQTINLEIHVKNSSKEAIADFNVRLIKEIIYYVEVDPLSDYGAHNKKVVKHLIVSKETQGCNEHTNVIIRTDLLIPQISPTDFNSSSVVKVTYYVRISGSMRWPYKNPVVRIPITIGTHNVQDSLPDSFQLTPYTPTLDLPPLSFSSFDEPPNYAKAVFMAKFKNKSEEQAFEDF